MKNKNIQVIYIVTKLELGGAQKVCLSLFDGLEKSGCNAFLVSGSEGVLADQIKNKKQVFLLSTMIREISFFSLRSELTNFLTLIKALKKIKKQAPHVIVHTHSTKAGLIGRWAAWFAGIKNRVHTIHGYGFHKHQSWITWLPIYFLELISSFITTHFVCVCASDAKTGKQFFPGFTKKHSIIRAGVESKLFYQPAPKNPLPFKHNNFIFGTISCFKPQKNLIDLLKAFELAYHVDQRARLEIIGDGVQRKMLEAWITKHNLSTVITLHGWQHQIAPITKSWHAFALSSLWEGLPCAIIEARLQHLPVVSYKTGGIPEVVIDQQNGLLFDQGDWQGLGSGMIQLMKAQHLYRSMQQHPDDLSDFDTNYMITEHVKLYKQLLS